MSERGYYLLKAKIAHHAKRYEEMAMDLHNIIGLGTILTVQERNLLLFAYREIITSMRKAWRNLKYPVDEYGGQLFREQKLQIAYCYREEFENEIRASCNRIIYLIDTNRFPEETCEQGIFNYKTNADFYHYLAELDPSGEQQIASERSFNCYQTALSLAMQQLLPAHPLRLRVSLNFAIFYNNVLKNSTFAIELVRDELHRATCQIQHVPAPCYGSSACIMQELRDYLCQWLATVRRSKEVRVLFVKKDFKIHDDDKEDTTNKKDQTNLENSEKKSDMETNMPTPSTSTKDK